MNRKEKKMHGFVVNPQAAEFTRFWTSALENVLRFLRAQGIDSYEQLQGRYRARKLIDECLWKLTEVDGKYSGRYFSAGALKTCALLGPPNQSGRWRGEDRELCCQHEHVFERQPLIEELLAIDPALASSFVVPRAIGCVVLKSEHEALKGALPATLDSPWRRYENRVDVFDRKDGRWVIRRQVERSEID